MEKKFVFNNGILKFDGIIREQIYLPRTISRKFFGRKCKIEIKIEGN